MPYTMIETCGRCGKEIILKEVMSYRVLQDFRIVCKQCLKKSERLPPREIETKLPAEPAPAKKRITRG